MKETYFINYQTKKDLHILRKLALYSSIYQQCDFIKNYNVNDLKNYSVCVFITHDLVSLVKIKALYQKVSDVKFLILADGENITILSTLAEDNFIIIAPNCRVNEFRENICYLNQQMSFDINITKREKQILILILKGQNNNHIASQLGISERTIEAHRRNIYQKLGVHSLSQLTLWAINNKMY
ncbi:MAG: response regulator transcription factor [Pleomorphochaeta sp.]